jgi:hypothetical protein
MQKITQKQYENLKLGNIIVFYSIIPNITKYNGTKGKIVSKSEDRYGFIYEIIWENDSLNRENPGKYNWAGCLSLYKDENLKCRK